MADSRIKSLAVIGIHRRRALNIDLDEVVDKFIQKCPDSQIVLVQNVLNCQNKVCIFLLKILNRVTHLVLNVVI